MDINLTIERLIIEGIPLDRRQQRQLQTAVERELARLLAEGGVSWQAGIALPHVPAGTIELTANHRPTHLGRQIAQAIYSGIGPNAVPRPAGDGP
jgi:hypothetical protein